jgi:uncharacterized protein YqfA (UPF0365 family)
MDLITNSAIFGVILIVFMFLILALILRFVPIGLWISAIAASVEIRILDLVMMRFRRIAPARIVHPLIKAQKAGLNTPISYLESHYLAGGNVDRVIDALIAAKRDSIPLTFERAAAIDFAGRDVLEAVQMCVTSKVIQTPPILAVAMNGIELKAVAKVTVRTNIDRLVGGAGEETIIARVGEGIVNSIGSSETHNEVLENPDLISMAVLSKGLDAGTAFDILSIDMEVNKSK